MRHTEPEREWTVTDHDGPSTVISWRAERRLPDVHPSWLPPDTYVARLNGEPVAAAAFYLTLCTGVAWMDWLIAAPGAPTATAREAFAVLIREFWDRHGGPYRILRGTGLEVLRHEAEAMGFVVSAARFREMMMECPAEFLVEPGPGSPQP